MIRIKRSSLKLIINKLNIISKITGIYKIIDSSSSSSSINEIKPQMFNYVVILYIHVF